jgi:hypothetical protein
MSFGLSGEIRNSEHLQQRTTANTVDSDIARDINGNPYFSFFGQFKGKFDL